MLEGIHGDVAYIPLTQGQTAIVDADDYYRLREWKWHAHYNRGTRSYYAQRTDNRPGALHTISMHRAVVACPGVLMLDHVNRNTLDNRKANLRPATNSQNQANRVVPRNNTSGYKGVCWDNYARAWFVRVGDGNSKTSFVGRFATLEDAVAARDRADIARYGEFARPNFAGGGQ